MSIASVMAVYDGSCGSAKAMETAVGVGQLFDAVTAFLQVEPPTTVVSKLPRPRYRQNADCSCVENLERSISDERQRFETLFHDTIVAGGFPVIQPSEMPDRHSFGALKLTVTGHENREIARRGRLFDLIVLPRPTPDCGELASASIEAALLDTGRPVMIASGDTGRFINDRVTIAWDGSREAAVSVRNALPFIGLAESVEVIHVANVGEKRADPSDVSRYLALHGIRSEPRVVPRLGRDRSEVIAEAARENGDALLVMGAHGEGDLAEDPVGGVTQSVILAADLHVLLSH